MVSIVKLPMFPISDTRSVSQNSNKFSLLFLFLKDCAMPGKQLPRIKYCGKALEEFLNGKGLRKTSYPIMHANESQCFYLILNILNYYKLLYV